MPQFKWYGLTLEGASCKGNLFARSYDQLQLLLKDKDIGLVSADIQYFSLKADVKISFIIQLAQLLRSHISLYNALSIIRSTTIHQDLSLIIQDLEESLKEGKTFFEALSYHDSFDDIFKITVSMGESTGQIGQALEHLSGYLEKLSAFKKIVKDSLFIPFITFLFFLCAVLFAFIFVIPRYALFLKQIKGPLPFSTSCIITISNIILSPSFTIVIALIAFAIAYILKWHRFSLRYHSLIIKLPIGIKAHRIRIVYTLALLLKAHIPLAQALQLCSKATQEKIIEKNLLRILEKVKSGFTLSKSIEGTLLYSRRLYAFVELGESAGELPSMLNQAAQFEEQELLNQIKRLCSLVQPCLLLLLGFFIAGLIFSLYMPLLTLTSMIG